MIYEWDETPQEAAIRHELDLANTALNVANELVWGVGFAVFFGAYLLFHNWVLAAGAAIASVWFVLRGYKARQRAAFAASAQAHAAGLKARESAT